MSAAPEDAPATVTLGANAQPRLRYVLRLADTSLILGQRLGEWVGRAPAIEEDMGLANLALDCIGQSRQLLAYAAELDGRNLTEDDLAFRRDEPDFLNLLIAELPSGDFGRTIVRQFLVDAFLLELYGALGRSSDARLVGIAGKAEKELRYHLRYSQGWLVRLGDGTEDSHRRVQRSLDELWRFTSEFFLSDEVDQAMAGEGVGPDPATLAAAFRARIASALKQATLKQPPDEPLALLGRSGRHTEGFGRLLAEMQFMARAYPGARW